MQTVPAPQHCFIPIGIELENHQWLSGKTGLISKLFKEAGSSKTNFEKSQELKNTNFFTISSPTVSTDLILCTPKIKLNIWWDYIRTSDTINWAVIASVYVTLFNHMWYLYMDTRHKMTHFCHGCAYLVCTGTACSLLKGIVQRILRGVYIRLK